ncbi:MAG: choice-of-anchor D domain-containing protein, partial [Planctomycetaceae bacterium]|nr:choice-of-anchor D domain-containing protein [Planctomycetaceae bacterium]
MRLPLSAWKHTLRRLGLRIAKRKPQPPHAKTRTAQLEVLERREVMTAEITDFRLLNDTGTSSTDELTSDPRLTVTVDGDFPGGTVEVEFDHNNNQAREAFTIFALPGDSQIYNPATTDPNLETYTGEVTIHYRYVEYDGSHQQVSAGAWTPFAFSLEHPPEPEIDVQDSSAVSLGDGVGLVGYGDTPVGTPLTKTFTIHNMGEAALTIDTNSFNTPAGFTVTQLPSSSVPIGGQTTFAVRLNATTPGVFTGQLSFASNDSDENPYNFDLSGQVLNLQPELTVRLPSNAIVEQYNTVDWGTTQQGTSRTLTLTIHNDGTAPLTLDPNSVAMSSGFTVVTPFASSLPAISGQTTFVVRLDAEQPGSYFGLLSFNNGDADENPFTIGITGLVLGGGYTGQNIDVVGLNLVNDTGVSTTDYATYDPRLAGTVEGDFADGKVEVQFDHDSDGLVDGFVTVLQSGGALAYDPALAAPELATYVGPLALRYRVVPQTTQGVITSIGEWYDFPLELLARPAAGNLRVIEIGLVNDTGSSTIDKLTVDPSVYAVVSGDLQGGSARIEFDHDGDGLVEGSIAVTNSTSEFTYNPRSADPAFGTTYADIVLSYRLLKLDAAGATLATGGWDTFRFTTEELPPSDWTVTDFGLVNDTGENTSDGITSDPTLEGTATGSGSSDPMPLGMPLAWIEFNTDQDPEPDATVATDDSGQFTFTPSVAAYDQPLVIQARVKRWNTAYNQFQIGAWSDTSITVQAPPAPAVENLRLVNDTGTVTDDERTRDATIAGRIQGGIGSLLVEFDLDGNEAP